MEGPAVAGGRVGFEAEVECSVGWDGYTASGRGEGKRGGGSGVQLRGDGGRAGGGGGEEEEEEEEAEEEG